MTTTGQHRYQSEFANRYFSQGEANALLRILDARDIVASDEFRQRVATCTDLDQLDAWVLRAATANTIEDLDA